MPRIPLICQSPNVHMNQIKRKPVALGARWGEKKLKSVYKVEEIYSIEFQLLTSLLRRRRRPMHHLLTHIGRWRARGSHALVHWRSHLVSLWRWPLVKPSRWSVSHRWRRPSHTWRGTRRKSTRWASHLWTAHLRTSGAHLLRGEHWTRRAVHILWGTSHLVRRSTHGRWTTLGWASHWRTTAHRSSHMMRRWRSIRRRSTRWRTVSPRRWTTFLISGSWFEIKLELQATGNVLLDRRNGTPFTT